MALEARISSLWSKQKLFISIFFVLVALPFLYDGKIGWPQSNVRWSAHEQLARAGNERDWPAYAQSHGWVAEVPHRFYGTGDIIGQYVVAGLCAIVGSLLFIYWATQKKRTLRADEEAVYTPAGNRVPFGSITGIGKKRWESKGLATVRYQEEGRQRQFVVDDYKFEAEPTHQILAEIEERLTARSGVGV